MIRAYGLRDHRLCRLDEPPTGPDAASDVVWLDLINPTRDEEGAVETMLGLQVPTRQEMAEIEDSARLYEERGSLVMTAVVLAGVAEDHPVRTQVTFVLTKAHLVSVRYTKPVAFRAVETKCHKQTEDLSTSDRILMSLLESITERVADVLEGVAGELNEVSTRLFIDDDDAHRHKSARFEDELQTIIRRLGRKNMTVSILRESLMSVGRLVPFLRRGAQKWLASGTPARLKQVERDIRSLSAYENQLSSEIVYLHDATLGLINLDQNRIIKVLSIGAVLFLPPTLVGTIYGMNFHAMPELGWAWGYPAALLLMLLSAIPPYYWFRWRGWL